MSKNYRYHYIVHVDDLEGDKTDFIGHTDHDLFEEIATERNKQVEASCGELCFTPLFVTNQKDRILIRY